MSPKDTENLEECFASGMVTAYWRGRLDAVENLSEQTREELITQMSKRDFERWIAAARELLKLREPPAHLYASRQPTPSPTPPTGGV